MNTKTLEVLTNKLKAISESGKTSLDILGIDADRISQAELKYPHMAKQGLWQSEQKEAC